MSVRNKYLFTIQCQTLADHMYNRQYSRDEPQHALPNKDNFGGFVMLRYMYGYVQTRLLLNINVVYWCSLRQSVGRNPRFVLMRFRVFFVS